MDLDDLDATPAVRYEALVDGLLAQTHATVGISQKQGFGATSLTVGGKIFAMLVQDRLVVKLPRPRVDALVDAGAGERFSPGSGRVMKEWFSLDPDATEDWLNLAREALAFVRPKSV